MRAEEGKKRLNNWIEHQTSTCINILNMKHLSNTFK